MSVDVPLRGSIMGSCYAQARGGKQQMDRRGMVMQGNGVSVKTSQEACSQISIKQYLLIKKKKKKRERIPAPWAKLVRSHPAISLINCLICKQRDPEPKPPPSSISSSEILPLGLFAAVHDGV